MIQPIYTSRSAYLTWQRCPRDRFLSFELFKGWEFCICPTPGCGNTHSAEGHLDVVACAFCGAIMDRKVHIGGIEPIQQSIYLVVGSAIHHGLEIVMEWASQTGGPHPIPQAIIEDAVAVAMTDYHTALEAGVNLHKCPPEHRDWKMAEQGALIEGLIRAAAIRLLPNLFDRYRVLEVEREDLFDIGKAYLTENDVDLGTPVVFQSRLDSLLEDRDTGDLHLLSFKTAKQWGKSEEMQFRRDVQGISEAWGVEQRLGRKVEAIQMVILLKGKEYEDRGNGYVDGADNSGGMDNKGRWVHYNPLTRAYATFQNGITPEFDSMTWTWSYDTMKTYVKGPRKGESYKGKLGGEWHPISTWDNYPGGMKAWIDLLVSGGLQPEMGDPLGGLFIMPEPWTRSGREIEDLMDELTWIETQIPPAAVAINEMLKTGEGAGFVRRELSVEFPRNTSSCYRYGGMCPNEAVCFGSLSLTPEDLVGIGKPWRLRKGHHEAEVGE
jgi:hypothetical protein